MSKAKEAIIRTDCNGATVCDEEEDFLAKRGEHEMGSMIRTTGVLVTIFFSGSSLIGCSTPELPIGKAPKSVSIETVPLSPTGIGKTSTASTETYGNDEIVESQHFYTGPPHVLSSGKIAYLTFDDGPSESTSKILHILKKFGVTATFFVIGADTSEGRAFYKQIVAEGHALGNHTYTHDYNRIYKSPEAFMKDVRRLDQLLEETVGYRPDILRFPGGSNNHLSWKPGGRGIMSKVASEVKKEGYQYFDWNVSSTDAAAPVQAREMIIDSVLSASRGKKSIIVLMHDNTYKTTTLEALPIVIKKLQAAGFHFEKLKKSSFTFQFLEP
ncbi:polysaccharide deacetylase family protein [Paenibacillus alginolyticus]|uniref:Polysaccharide deacetylase n=1 Tax=Paenibacillus alginolyticus TaxID=59839 RepID=A0ABT4GJM9_9BACL|nr:polysaccharide deacetylase family protein [Paenibacillus alginolyticus]MCY9696385.1 polysaccharide deacetylase [Paenibacillus alginolyticus]MEC0143164.1 polysaccharide deacetylase [Paenibacillus alginolyticus]